MRRLRLLPLLLCLSLLSACVVAPRGSSVPEEARMAEALYREGEFQQAAQAFLDAANGDRNRRDSYRLRALEAWREGGELQRGEALLEEIREARLSSDEALRLDLVRAEFELQQDNPAAALRQLESSPTSVPPGYRQRFHFLRARAYDAVDAPFAAAAERAWLAELGDANDVPRNDVEIRALLSRVDDLDLSEATATLEAGHPLYRYAGAELTERGMAIPRPYSRNSLFGGQPGLAGYRSIALILPASGPLAIAGEAVRDGFMAAYFADRGAHANLRIYDAGETPEAAVTAYRRAAADGAEIAVGPLGRDSVAALFELGEVRVPVLALNRGGGAPPPPGSVSFALTPEDEGHAAASRMQARGWLRAISATATDDHSQRAVSAFRQRYQALGGTLVAEIQLPAESPDFQPAIRAALAAAGRRTDAAGQPAGADFDAFFLAVRPAQARLLVAQLQVFDGSDRPILATSQVHDGDGNPRQDRELDGVEFPELPWLLDDTRGSVPARSEVQSLASARGAGARLFAFGIDAYQLVAALPQLSTNPNASVAGATGQLSLDGFGQVVRQPAWARFIGSRPRPAPDAEPLRIDTLPPAIRDDRR